jgi:CubicO group peptidase (beta-lactamase class C family)
MDPYASEHVEIVDLAAMRSGLPGHPGVTFSGATDAEVVANLHNLPLSTELRQIYQYNDLHYSTLAHVIATLTGTPYVDWLDQNVLKPLNMTSSKFDYTGVTTESFRRTGVNLTQCAHSPDLDHLDPGCFGSLDSTGFWNKHPYVKGASAGGAGLISTTRDLVCLISERADSRASGCASFWCPRSSALTCTAPPARPSPSPAPRGWASASRPMARDRS